MKKNYFIFLLFIFLLFIFAGCSINISNEITHMTCADDPTQEKCSDPEKWDWQYNRFSFNGKNMQVLILH